MLCGDFRTSGLIRMTLQLGKKHVHRQANFVPGSGVDGLQLGATCDEVKARLDPLRNFTPSNDNFTWESVNPECVWYFAKATNGDVRLRQVIADACDVLINGIPLQGLALDECLLSLGVKSFNETLWCRENVFLDYKDGKQIPDHQRVRDKRHSCLAHERNALDKESGTGVAYGRW